MTKKSKLAFEMLAQEMELISNEKMMQLKGGTDVLDGTCLFQTIAFATGLSVYEVQNAYASHIRATTGTGMDQQQTFAYVGVMGVSNNNLSWIMSNYGLSSGYSSTGGYSTSSSGDAGVVLIDTNGDGSPDHAVNVTGNANSTGWYYYDPQSSSGGMISANDPRIKGTFGF